MVKVKGVLPYRAIGLDLKALLGARRYTLMFADSLKKMALCFANVSDITVTTRVSIYYKILQDTVKPCFHCLECVWSLKRDRDHTKRCLIGKLLK